MKRSNRTAALGIVGAVVLGTLAAAPAGAQSSTVQARGQCSASSQWKLKAGHDNGAIETEFEVDSNRAGQTWNIVVKDNGAIVFSGARTTTAPSGSFSVTRRIADKSGLDHLVASAKNVKTGETCVGRVSV